MEAGVIFRLSLFVLRLFARIVPGRDREAWLREWEAELWDRRAQLTARRRLNRRQEVDMLRRVLGAFHDAAWLRRQFTRDSEFLQDLRFSVRLLRRNPGFTLLAVSALALGLGGTVAAFSVADTLLIRELPYRDVEQVMTIWSTDVARPDERLGVAPGVFLEWRDHATTFSAFAAADPDSFDYLDGSEPATMIGARVTDGFFAALGARAALGRLFRPEDYAAGGRTGNVVVLSDGAWQRYFGGDAAIIGRTVVLDGAAHEIVGVLPRNFHPDLLRRAREQEVWAPAIVDNSERQSIGSRYWVVVGRLRSGATVAQAQAELAAVSSDMGRRYPNALSRMTATLVPLRSYVAGPVRTPLIILVGAVVLVLLLGCANVGGLLLSRAAERQREMSVRAAIGAARGRLIRQMLIESLVLAMIAWAAGLGIAYLAIGVFVANAAGSVRHLGDLTLDTRITLFAVLLAVLTALVGGIWPAVRLSRPALHGDLKHGSATSTGSPHGRRVTSGLVVFEVAVSLILLAGAGLLIRSFTQLSAVDPGFTRTNVAVLQVFAYGDRYRTSEQLAVFYDRVLEKMRTTPGVTRAGAVSAMPFIAANINIRGAVRVEGRPAPPSGEQQAASLTVASDEYFRALRIPLRRGRLFTAADRSNAPPVGVVNDLFAERIFPGENPVGHRLTVTWLGRPRTVEIVGVVGRFRHDALDAEPRAEVFMPLAQLPYGSMTFVAATSGDSAALMPALKTAIWQVDPTLPLYSTGTLDSFVANTLAPRRFMMLSLGLLAALAFVLATLGIYGIVSFTTTQRTKEIGVRMAVGGSAADVLRHLVGHNMAVVGAGVAVGVLGSLVASRALRSLLYGVSPSDPVTLATVAGVLALVAGLACYVPARRATRIDPVNALRGE